MMDTDKIVSDGRTVYFSAVRDGREHDVSEVRFLGLDITRADQAKARVGVLGGASGEGRRRVVLPARATAGQLAQAEEAVRGGWRHAVHYGAQDRDAIGAGVREVSVETFPPRMVECPLYTLTDAEIAAIFSSTEAQAAQAGAYAEEHLGHT